MIAEAKKKILEKLAATGDAKAISALEKEVSKVASILAEEINYDIVITQIDLLDGFAYRMPEVAFRIVETLLEKLKTVELTHTRLPGLSEGTLKRYHNNNTVIVKLLSLLKHIRYHLPEKNLRLFLDYTNHPDEDVRKEAFACLKSFAEYNLDIFYGDGKDWGGLGPQPQEKVLQFISSLNEDEQKKYIPGVVALCEHLLSPTISGTSSTYRQLVMRTGVVPPDDYMKDIRHRAIHTLRQLYRFAGNLSQKKQIIHALQAATRTPMTNYDDKVYEMIMDNTSEVLTAYQEFLPAESDLQIVQDIEHAAYWNYKRTDQRAENTKRIALEVKDAIDHNDEYQIFKVLIGFDGIFSEWRMSEENGETEGKLWENEYRETKKFRDAKVEEFAESINEKNYVEWTGRILKYAKVQSNDLATFPYFYKFLEYFGRSSPNLAFKFLVSHASELEGFLTPIFFGIWGTSHQKQLRDQLLSWIDAGLYLSSIVRLFEWQKDLDLELIGLSLQKAKESPLSEETKIVLRQIISTIMANYDASRQHLLNSIFYEAVQMMTALKDWSGMMGIWFLQDIDDMVNAMDEQVIDAILDNLLFARRIEHQAERILTAIAQKFPEKIIHFLGKRMEAGESKTDFSYDAIPFNFYSLQKPLSAIPETAVDIVSQWYESGGLFTYKGGRLLSNIFSDFPQRFQNKLLNLVQSGQKNNLMIVMGILRHYHGNPLIHSVCKELIKALPLEDKALSEIRILLRDAGVVSGEYGLLEAYKRKKQEVSDWLTDDHEKVRSFAKKYIELLDLEIIHEQKRADEDIELMKFKYGEGDI